MNEFRHRAGGGALFKAKAIRLVPSWRFDRIGDGTGGRGEMPTMASNCLRSAVGKGATTETLGSRHLERDWYS